MANDEKVVELAAGGPNPRVEISFNQPIWARYDIELFDPAGQNPVQIGTGVSTVPGPHIFPINSTPAQLDKSLLVWIAKIRSYTTGQTVYNVTMNITQGDTVCTGSPVIDNGTFTTLINIHELVRFKTV